MRTPVFAPDDRDVADLCLAADGLLDAHLAGAAVGPPAPGHRALVRLPRQVADAALAAGAVEISDAESMPVARLDELSVADQADPEQVILTGTASPARAATGVGQSLRISRLPLPAEPDRTVVVLARPPLPGELAAIEPPLLLAVPIGSASPDGVPAATLLRLAERAAAELGQVSVRAVTLAWRDPVSDAHLAEAVAAGLGGRLRLLAAQDSAWRDLCVVLAEHPDAVADRAGPELAAELLRWRPPRASRGLAVFFTGLSGAGKSTLARGLADHLLETGSRTVTLLDGDEVRRLLSAGLGFGAEGRDQNVRRIGYVAAEVTRHGGVAICAPIAPYERSRAAARAMVSHAGGDFVLVHVATSLADCEARDVKGLYARARSGEIPEFTGVSDPYEIPEHPELRIETAGRSVAEATAEVVEYLTVQGWLAR